MEPAPAGSLLAFLSQIPDPRGRQGRRHPMEAMVATVVCAMLQGARGFTAIAEWIHAQEAKLWHLLGYTRRPPTSGAYRKLLLMLPADHLEAAVRSWLAYCLGVAPDDAALQALAMDGKSLCGTLEPHARTVQLLSLLDQQTGCVLSQTRVDVNTNEAKTALDLLTSLVLKGRVVTGDAAFCQREICQQIHDAGGHYLFIVKDNQPALKEAIAAEFQAAFSPDERTSPRIAS